MTQAYPESSASLTAPCEPRPVGLGRLSLVKTFVRSHLLGTLTVSVAGSLVLFGATTWNVWSLYRGYRDAIATQVELKDLSGTIVHLDEVLTMSARMAASTGNTQWEERYRQFEPDLIQAIEKTTQLVPAIVKAQSAQTDAANLKLIDFENRAFKLVRQGQPQQALKLLLSREYEQQKQIYATGISQVIRNIRASIDQQLHSYEQRLFWSGLFAIASLLILLPSWLLLLVLIKTYLRERQQAQDALLASQQSLLVLNTELEAKASQIQQQEQLTKQENERLQQDIGQLLDVVCAVEGGDLTVQAPISDRVTGLVADTFNRLTEELARVLSTVLSTTQQVTQGTDRLEQLADRVAQQTQRQARSVVEVKALVENINTLTQDTAQQALIADAAVQQAQQAVSQGQQEIELMTRDMAALKQGTEQILKRIQSLNDFVELASQFTKDQKRVSALTRVLALNASMIAARASGQQDPEQFASAVREFETIATQVNDLAVQTNQSLQLLQQRTEQIQTAVVSINHDAGEVSHSVDQLTSSVQQSHQVLVNIQSVTQQVAQVEQDVTQASQNIAALVQGVLQAVQEIATVADETKHQSQFTREQSGAMRQLANLLLDSISFFRLSETSPQSPSPLPQPATAVVHAD